MEVRGWPEVEAEVIESRIFEMDTSNDITFSTRISVDLRLEYVVNGESYRTDYARDWTRRRMVDWSEMLSRGSKFPIRVSPENPEIVSLLDHNGIP